MTVLAFHDLAIRRGGRLLFAPVSATLGPGQALAVTGANGAGKTSLLGALAGLVRPAAGRIERGGAEGEAGGDFGAGLHLIGHRDGLKSGRTVAQELAFARDWLDAQPQALARAVSALALEPLLNQDVRRLSVGQRRRVALARLVMAPRPLWLLDEPMAPLDGARRRLVAGLMADHLARGGSLVAAVHDPLPIEAEMLELTPA